MISATIPLPEREAREHNRTAVSLWFSGHSSLYRISIMGALSHYYHLFNQNFTGRRDSAPRYQKVGDLVFILAKHIQTTCPSKKLSKQYLGLFEVTGKPGSHSFQIRLPKHLQSIHPVFYISQLEPCPTSPIPNRTNPPPPPIIVNGEIKFEIAQILNSKLD